MFRTLAAVTAVALLGSRPANRSTPPPPRSLDMAATWVGISMGGNFSRENWAEAASLRTVSWVTLSPAGASTSATSPARLAAAPFGATRLGALAANLAPHGAIAAVAPGANWRGQQGFDHSHGWFAGRDFQRGNVGWAGPVFWPYAYNDLFDYAFDPYYDGLDGGLFWAYGYDDLFAGVLLPYVAGAIANGVGAAPNASSAPAPRHNRRCARFVVCRSLRVEPVDRRRRFD